MSNKEENVQELEENGLEETQGSDKKKRKSSRRKRNADNEKIAELEAEVAELKDKYLRLFAEFDNYKKRTVKEKLDMMRNAAKDTLSSLLPVLDDFDRAKKTADDDATSEVFTEGVEMVYNKLRNAMNLLGVKPMETTGEVFDPELHEAITEIPAPSEDMKGKVIDTIEQGYYLNDTIIRHAKVVVGR